LRRRLAAAWALPLVERSAQQGTQEVIVTRTFGAAIGALIFVFFMSYIAERLTTVQASSTRPTAASRR
jgi:hypothetical protein